jgi:hypothetical protein
MAKAAAANRLPAFVVDKKGLAKLLERKGKSFAIVELIQNAWDEDTTTVHVTLEKQPAKGDRDDLWKLVVEDDNPEGFKDLAHAYTLFAESAKKGDATKRGRFNLGEKLVIAVCEIAQISTTKGTVRFIGDNREMRQKTREAGSEFLGFMRLTDAEAAEIEAVVRTLLPPEGIETTFNLSDIEPRVPVRTFEATLKTEIADAEGRLKPTTRKTKVEVYEPLHGETASIYEMGIPVVETGDRWHVNVLQKVPLPYDRDNVPPGYLRDVRVAVLNACHDLITEDDARQGWVAHAMEDKSIVAEATAAAFYGRFGDKVVIHDPNDLEANNRAKAEGYIVVPGGALSKEAWAQVKEAGFVLPAGQVTPSPSMLASASGEDVKAMNPDHWPAYIRNVVDFAVEYAEKLMGVKIVEVTIGTSSTYPANATWERVSAKKGRLMLNVGRLGHKWFQQVGPHVLDILFDEFGHQFASNHLTEDYYRALRKLGADAVQLALKEPEFFAEFGFDTTPVLLDGAAQAAFAADGV